MKTAHDPLVDSEIQEFIQESIKNISLDTIDRYRWKMSDYFDAFVDWINSSSHNKVIGLENFPHKAFSAGTIEGIQSFLHRHCRNRRIRFSRAEFVGSKIVSNHCSANWLFLEDGELETNDALVISLPFSGNGGILPDYDKLMQQATDLDVPVLIDLAYFGISFGMHIDLTWPCIKDVVISLSKPMSAHLRLGMRFTKELHDDMMQSNSDSIVINRISAQMGIELLRKFSHDFIISKYKDKANAICQLAGLTPTNTITLALGNEEQHKDFFRNGYYRVCITDELLQNL